MYILLVLSLETADLDWRGKDNGVKEAEKEDSFWEVF